MLIYINKVIEIQTKLMGQQVSGVEDLEMGSYYTNGLIKKGKLLGEHIIT